MWVCGWVLLGVAVVAKRFAVAAVAAVRGCAVLWLLCVSLRLRQAAPWVRKPGTPSWMEVGARQGQTQSPIAAIAQLGERQTEDLKVASSMLAWCLLTALWIDQFDLWQTEISASLWRQPARQPASKPASQPAGQPASQQGSQPAGQPADPGLIGLA